MRFSFFRRNKIYFICDMKRIEQQLFLFDGNIWIISINLKIQFEIKIHSRRNHRWPSNIGDKSHIINDHIIHKYGIFSSFICFHLSELISIEVWIRYRSTDFEFRPLFKHIKLWYQYVLLTSTAVNYYYYSFASILRQSNDLSA